MSSLSYILLLGIIVPFVIVMNPIVTWGVVASYVFCCVYLINMVCMVLLESPCYSVTIYVAAITVYIM